MNRLLLLAVMLAGCCCYERLPDKKPYFKHDDKVWLRGHEFYRDQIVTVISYQSNERRCTYTVKFKNGSTMYWVPESNLTPTEPHNGDE